MDEREIKRLRRALISMKAARDYLRETLEQVRDGGSPDIDYVLTVTDSASGEGEAIDG